VITRAANAGGEEHEAIDRESFALRRAAGAYALTWDAHDLRYAIPADIALDLSAGHIVVASVSRSVIAEAALRYPARVIEITAPPEILAQRLAARGREGADMIAARLAREVARDHAVDTITIVNDATVAEGAEKLISALRRAAESAARN
jgi:phosphonate metabolism protein PhnN/1,5-bisphosphokinase (PRPP-forming)